MLSKAGAHTSFHEDLPPIITPATQAAVKNLTKAKLATSLWKTKEFIKFGPAGNLK